LGFEFKKGVSLQTLAGRIQANPRVFFGRGMAKNLNITIADVSIAFEGCGEGDITPAYRPFVDSGNRDITLRLHR
jgi:hypothetical protein